MFLYPDWWINENIRLIEEREKPAIVNFPPREIVANRIDAILAFDRTADLPHVRTPTLILCAKDDVLAADTARRRRTLPPSNEPCWISSAGFNRPAGGSPN